METSADRRGDQRVAAGESRWGARAILRPGHDVTLVNVGAGGVLIETTVRLLPGKRVDLQLMAADGRRQAPGRVLRCHLIGLSPVMYRAAIAVEPRLDATSGSG